MKRQPAGERSNQEPKLSRAHPPAGVAAADWQRALRRQFGRGQAFALENLGDQPFFSEFRVGNPLSKAGYRMAIRGLDAGDNYCRARTTPATNWVPASTSSSSSPDS